MAYDRQREDIDALVEESADSYEPFTFADPNQIMKTFNPALANGSMTMAGWQEEVNTFVSGNHGQITPDRNNQLFFHLVAANGSGKDSMVIAALCVYMAMTQVRSRSIVTSKSVTQLRKQTEPNVKMLCEQVNKKLGQKVFLCRNGHYFCYNTGAEIVLFCTDEEERAEGFHPWSDKPDAMLMIIANEAKSIGDNVMDALGRCTYTHWVEISSAGKRQGKFYRSYEQSLDWSDLRKWNREQMVSRKITSYDCPWKTEKVIEKDAIIFGRNSAVFRSKHLSEFCAEADAYVISESEIDLSINERHKKLDFGMDLHVGCDAAQGGDLNAMYAFDENMYLDRMRFSLEDTVEAAKIIREWLDIWWENGLKPEAVTVDDGVASKPIFDMVRKHEYPDPDNPGQTYCRWADIVGCRNQSKAIGEKGVFGNRGAQNYFKFKKLVHLITWPREWTKKSIPLKQLLSRQYVQKGADERLYLQPKREIPRGESPDDADAIVLAFSQADVTKILKAKEVESPQVKRNVRSTMPQSTGSIIVIAGAPPKNLAAAMEAITYGDYDGELSMHTKQTRDLIPSLSIDD